MTKTYNTKQFDATKEPMFFGESVGVARYDKMKHPFFDKLTEKQLSFFWRPEEVDLSNDRKEFNELPDHEKHIFTSNLRYQTLLDSVQGRAPSLCFLPVVSLPELETWIETWSFSETVHSRSYTHIIRNIYNDPSEVFDNINSDTEILKRAASVTKYYDNLLEVLSTSSSMYEKKKALYLCMVSINILEAIRFYVSFACSFAFAERAIMEGNAKIIKLIARDESLHLTGTQHILNLLSSDADDNEFKQIAIDCKDEAIALFYDAAEQEKEWAKYLFKDGSMIGLNAEILGQYIDHITNIRMRATGFSNKPVTQNPLPWMNSWLNSDAVQVAPQESEISSYLVGQIDSSLSEGDFDEFEF